MKAKFAGILSALLATTCCVGPLVLVAIGLGSGAAFLGRYQWLFLIGGIAVLTWAWAKYLRENGVRLRTQDDARTPKRDVHAADRDRDCARFWQLKYQSLHV